MTRDEMSFEAYVVLGNVLHLLVNGIKTEDQQRLALPVAELQRLHAALEPVRANQMLSALETMTEPDRKLLGDGLALCEQLADTQAEHLLGAPAEIRNEVARMLLDPAAVAAGGLA